MPVLAEQLDYRGGRIESIRNLTPAVVGDALGLRERPIVGVHPRLDLCSMGGGAMTERL